MWIFHPNATPQGPVHTSHQNDVIHNVISDSPPFLSLFLHCFLSCMIANIDRAVDCEYRPCSKHCRQHFASFTLPHMTWLLLSSIHTMWFQLGQIRTCCKNLFTVNDSVVTWICKHSFETVQLNGGYHDAKFWRSHLICEEEEPAGTALAKLIKYASKSRDYVQF